MYSILTNFLIVCFLHFLSAKLHKDRGFFDAIPPAARTVLDE